ncbi:bifunctional [glutamine synthetase] adenylyltransferase/[glutamine synthetase]-adenylyl-L-tyrosine phosphorylase [Paracoccus sp. (in: a-proteobacteria)]|uniref:bifunctional [glutamine synthetase] adenylyltransferase/[glutamine synthetase]-adenylyl-L-tyrosine phosphorylase n=1 Tax=Paracoccus sp. TaxID=267 RepID=UPI0026DF76BB|nr:bifunctional [glutamine synthetase] adenylyltransferase/[glutamine synthetase]-adenylyl-L-tyrosine phosphorylase [Paracoccus sp. (in: a-proteobacteria)]MDO5369778.1 bifunctional [glutamine synthetase] adenylyltransferase/[glutamine synthetase]-adenylyl-L-tyrosine phosphorylase [Paracoccus sp. (in: a-proteobacteria)]
MSFARRITRLPLPTDDARGKAAAAHLSMDDPRLTGLLCGAGGSSPFLAGLIERDAPWLSDALARDPAPAALVVAETAGFDALYPAQLGPALRQAKRRVALYAALADLGGVWTLDEVTGVLTDLADAATDLALRAHVADEIRRGKLPAPLADAAPEAGGIFALAMGKMGARELNYSSDIDLIVLYDDAAYAPEDQHEVRAALIRATRKAAATLSDLTAHGYVFRTDLRLRPDASVTPVCISATAALTYYEAEGRSWERAAFIKARPCAGDLAAGQRFLDALRPFVWRRHLDFATVEDTHEMRRRIRDHKGLHGGIRAPGHDLKLGRGGIREIEFFAQTRQLIAGGRDPDLRQRRTVDALAALAEKEWIPPEVAAELAAHYRKHREIEHRIQMVNDAQTHAVPAMPEGIAPVAHLCGVSDIDAWCARLEQRLLRVEELAGDFFQPGGTGDARPDLGHDQAALVEGWQSYPALRSARARQVFARIEPRVLTSLFRAGRPDEALGRFDSFLRGLPAGVQLFSMFESNPSLIDLLGDICATSPGLAAYLARHPEVLDAVIAGSFFAPWPGVGSLRSMLSETLDRTLAAPEGGYERALDAARRWAHEWQFRVGVHHLRGLIEAEEAGQHYADIADAALAALAPLVTAEFARRHGLPPGHGAAVLGMGSLGARQLNAASDLDLIVIYDAAGAEGSEGPKPLATRAYYARLTQALLTAVTAPTAAGRLYEVDMRLRPSGRQGPVATGLDSFRGYQMHEAWTWEHLALTRARVVAVTSGALAGKGANEPAAPDTRPLAVRLEALRLEILAARGTDPRVLPDLLAMRQRIFAAKAPDGRWEAKIGRGRLQDIELFAQSLALRAASASRGAAMQLRAGRKAGLIGAEDADALAQAHRFLWRLHCAGRLLTERPLDMEALGQGGQDFLLRETGCRTLDELSTRLDTHVDAAGRIIDVLSGAEGKG